MSWNVRAAMVMPFSGRGREDTRRRRPCRARRCTDANEGRRGRSTARATGGRGAFGGWPRDRDGYAGEPAADRPPGCSRVHAARPHGRPHGDRGPRTPDRRRRSRRLGQVHAGLPAQTLARAPGPQGLLLRVELVGAREDAPRARARSATCSRPRRSRSSTPPTSPTATSARSCRCCAPATSCWPTATVTRRSRATWSAGCRPRLGARRVLVRAHARHHVLLQDAAGGGARPDPRGTAAAQVPRGGHGPRACHRTRSSRSRSSRA